MKKLLSSKLKRRINNKKGLSLLALIVAVTIIMLTVGASIMGLNLSYRSVQMGAKKDDAQSLAQRDCDIIMSIISKQAAQPSVTGTGTALDDCLTGSGSTLAFESSFFTGTVQADTDIHLYSTIYDPSQYDVLEQQTAYSGFDPNIQKRYVKIQNEARTTQDAVAGTTKTYDVYKITVSVYYGTRQNMFVTCDGEVLVSS